MEQIEFVGKMQAVSLQPGDTLVLSVEHHLTIETCERLRADLEFRFPGRTILVLRKGMSIGVLSKAETLGRIEQKLDGLIAALAEDEEPSEPVMMLDGVPAIRVRDQGQSLG